MGLVANLTFYNQLNIQDFQTLLFAGDPSGLAAVNNTTPMTVATFRAFSRQASPFDILRVLAPEKASETAALLRRIVSLAEYVQSLCGYLAANEELEPIHSVICSLLRTGADFEQALRTNPPHLAAGTIKHLCSRPDVDGVLQTNPDPARRLPRRRWPMGLCHSFQEGGCNRLVCRFRHICARCRSDQHGARACRSSASNPRALRPANQ